MNHLINNNVIYSLNFKFNGNFNAPIKSFKVHHNKGRRGGCGILAYDYEFEIANN